MFYGERRTQKLVQTAGNVGSRLLYKKRVSKENLKPER